MKLIAEQNSQTSDLNWLESRWAYFAIILISVIPVVFLENPPLADFGGHLGRMAIQVEGSGSEFLRQWYSFNWGLIPNLGTDIIIQVTGPVLGLERSLRFLLVVIVAIQASGYVYLSRVLHGRLSPAAIFALPLVYSFPFHYGFLNFLFSAGLATWAIGYWISLGSQGRIVFRSVIFAFLACGLWIAHLVGWAILLVFAGADELVRNRARGVTWSRSASACVLPMLSLLTPILFYVFKLVGSNGVGTVDRFFDWTTKFAFGISVLRDRWPLWDIGSVILLLGLIYWFYRSNKFTRHKGVSFGAILLFLLYLLMPGKIFSAQFADMRLLPMIFATALIAITPTLVVTRTFTFGLIVAAVLFFVGRTGGTAMSLAVEDQLLKENLTALEAVPRGTNLVSFVVASCEADWRWKLDRRFHLPGYAVARRHAFSNDQWMVPGAQLLHIHNPDAGKFVKDPSTFVSSSGCENLQPVRGAVDQVPEAISYIWVIGEEDIYHFDGWMTVKAAGNSAIYRRVDPSSNSAR